ncbi:MAG: DUF1743 domain-containing protein [Candidatus Altiarchaeota archaeon]|nr:DUF1743 domain-containing protein [Candidatus Altiarchaeota archaeon]
MFIGVDDTDSLKGGCTTYLAALLCDSLGVTGYPKLIRLNPNIPYRTRGNGAIAFQVEGDAGKIEKTTLDLVKKHAQLGDDNTNPGVVFIHELTPEQRKRLEGFYLKTVSELVTLEEAESVAAEVNAEVHRFKNGRGVIGALAAVGSKLPDKTYELIAYRVKRNYGKEKSVDEESVYKMDRETYPETFDNIDPDKKQILISPHGYDPVLCGIRGDSVEVVRRAWKLLKVSEEVERIQVFETNQGTDAHLRDRRISELKPYDCVIIEGEVIISPQDIEGGHVLFGLSDGSGKIACAAYEPTGDFRKVVRKLAEGDRIRVFGGIGKHPNTLNLEKLQVLELARLCERIPPECCGRRMTSAGAGKGFKCRKCGKKAGMDAVVLREVGRDLGPGLYEVPPRARRHLSKPLVRFRQPKGRFNSLKSKLFKVMRRGSSEP